MSENGEWHVLQLEYPNLVEEKYVLSKEKLNKLQNLENQADKMEKLISEKEALEINDDDEEEYEFPDVTPRRDLSLITHSVFYRILSAHQIEIRNPPLAKNNKELISLLTRAFSVFGKVMEVELPNKEAHIENILISYNDEKSVKRAEARDGIYAHQAACNEESFGAQRYLEQYQKVRPSVEELERISTNEINAFEKQEEEIRKRTGSAKIARHTEAEMKAIINKYKEREEKMLSKDFYGFHQNTLYTALLTDSEPVAPRHMKKQPKKKAPKPTKGAKPAPKA